MKTAVLMLCLVLMLLYANASGMVCFSTSADNVHCNMPLITSTTKKTVRYSMKTIKKHATEESCRSLLGGNVYDLTNWVNRQPDEDFVNSLCGKDGTLAFNNKHSKSSSALKTLSEYKIGVLRK